MGPCHCQYQAKLGIVVSDCLFSSSKKANATVSIQVELPFGAPSSQYLSFTHLKSMKAFECHVEGFGFFPINFLHGLLE